MYILEVYRRHWCSVKHEILEFFGKLQSFSRAVCYAVKGPAGEALGRNFQSNRPAGWHNVLSLFALTGVGLFQGCTTIRTLFKWKCILLTKFLNSMVKDQLFISLWRRFERLERERRPDRGLLPCFQERRVIEIRIKKRKDIKDHKYIEQYDDRGWC